MLALGLLADNPHLREPVMGHIYRSEGLGTVRVVGFSGRESDAPLGEQIWGAIADQLVKKNLFKDHYSPLPGSGAEGLGSTS